MRLILALVAIIGCASAQNHPNPDDKLKPGYCRCDSGTSVCRNDFGQIEHTMGTCSNGTHAAPKHNCEFHPDGTVTCVKPMICDAAKGGTCELTEHDQLILMLLEREVSRPKCSCKLPTKQEISESRKWTAMLAKMKAALCDAYVGEPCNIYESKYVTVNPD